MKITPEQNIVYEIKNVAEIPTKVIEQKEGKRRGNNRKKTKNRKYQTIHVMDSSVFPPIFKTKIIKHS